MRGKPGQRVRIRIVNAGSDTAFRVALGGHQMTVTHSDGFPVQPVTTDALLVGISKRFDVLVTLADGTFPLAASAEGTNGQGLAVVRTGAGAPPTASVAPVKLSRHVLLGTDLTPAAQVRLPADKPDTSHHLVLA